MSFGVMASESSRRSRSVSMETGGLPLVSTFALLTIVAGKDCVELTVRFDNIVNTHFILYGAYVKILCPKSNLPTDTKGIY